MTFPVVLGTGKRLLDRVPAKAFRLVENSVSSSGVIIAVYEPAGPVQLGSFAAQEPSAAELARREQLRHEG
jgi:hypothetical protein